MLVPDNDWVVQPRIIAKEHQAWTAIKNETILKIMISVFQVIPEII